LSRVLRRLHIRASGANREQNALANVIGMAVPSVIKGIFMRSKLAVAFILFVVLGSATTILTACTTVDGAGKDVSKAGHEVSEEANEHK